MTIITLHLCFFVLVIINVVNSKRYDIYQQCIDEYGLDLDAVLRQFRRTDDYLAILSKKTEKFEDFFRDVLIQTMSSNIQQMEKKIKEELGLPSDGSGFTTGPPTTTISKPRRLKYIKNRRQYREGSEETPAAKLEKVQMLEQYEKLNSPLTVEERNHYKNLGFMYAGEIIHALVKAFDGDPMEHSGHSTRGADTDGGGTTEHAHHHVATVEGISAAGNKTVPEIEPSGQRQRLRSDTRFSLVSSPYGLM